MAPTPEMAPAPDLFDGRALCVSLPARDLAGVTPSGSVFLAGELAEADLCPDLRAALDLILGAAGARGGEVRFLARPEIFTQGESLEWLRAALGGAEDHVCISDGAAIRVVPGMRNHVFFYALGRRAHLEAAQRLFSRAPELFPAMASQTNPAIRLRTVVPRLSPPTLQLQSETAPPAPDDETAPLWPFYLNVVSAAESAGHVLARPPAPFEPAPDQPVTLVPLTQVALGDEGFMHHLAALVARAYFDPDVHLILGLPRPAGDERGDLDRLVPVLEALARAPFAIPRAPGANVHICGDAFPWIEPLAAGSTLLVHDSVEIWRAPSDYLRQFADVRVLKARRPRFEAGAARLLAHILDHAPTVVRCAPAMGEWA